MRLPLVLLLMAALAVPSLARSAEYNPRKAGHPVRIVAYVVHPVGYLLDRLIFYPAWRIGQWEPLAALVGMKRTVRDVEVLPEAAKKRHPNVMIQIGPALPPEGEAPEPESVPE